MFDLLTMEELVLAAPDRLIRPRTVLMRPGWTFFLAGLARIDYVDGPHPIMSVVWTTFSFLSPRWRSGHSRTSCGNGFAFLS